MNHFNGPPVTLIIVLIPAVLGRNGTGDCNMGNNLIDQSCCNYNRSYCKVWFAIGTCLSCEPSTCDVVRGACFFDFEDNSSLVVRLGVGKNYIGSPLPTSCQELEERMCGAMNRKGFLCSECKPGYGPAPYSSTVKCFECKNDGSVKLWLLYLALELVPSTAFFFVVVFFNIRTTAPPYTAFVFFSQFFAFIYKIQPYIRLSLNLQVNKVFLRCILTLVSFWNLDFFRHVAPPFCVSSKLTDIYILLLDFISALYPLFLVVVTLGLIELHARNFRPLVILWRPVHKYFASCRRKLDPKASVIAASATFMSLSFSKILLTAFLSVTLRKAAYDNHHVSMGGMYDSSVHCNHSAECWKQLASTPYFPFLLMLLIIVHLPTLLLLLYPLKAFRRLLGCCCSSKLHAVCFFVDTFQGHYKDGTTGSRDYRAASSISFLLRTLLCLIVTNYRSHYGVPAISGIHLGLAFFLLLTSLFYGVVQPCKQKYINVIESVVYFAAGSMLLSFGSIHDEANSSAHVSSIILELYFSLIFLVLPSVMLLLLSASKILSCFCCCSKSSLLKRATIAGIVSIVQEEEIPDRVKNPLNYKTLH